MGAAAATVISQLVYFIILYSIAQKFYHIPYEIFKILKILVLGISLYLLSTLSNEMSLLARLLIKTGIIFVFPILLYLIGFYEKVEIDRLRGFWIKWKNPSTISGNIREIFQKEKNEE